MKKYSFAIPEFMQSTFFSPVREKRDIIIILMKSIKHMLISSPVELHECKSESKLHLVKSKMNRLFIESKEKSYSIAFPFLVDDDFNFYTNRIGSIDNQVTSDVISILNDDIFIVGNSMYDFMDGLSEFTDRNHEFWDFLLQLFLMEDGYVRLDHDPKRADPVMHPEHHFDIFYSQGSSWKIGLKDKLSLTGFIDCIDSNKNCHYIE